MSESEQVRLRGVVERITFQNEENGYTVAKMTPERAPRELPHWQKEVTLIGNMVGLSIGESVEVEGSWTVHPEYGRQLNVERMRSVLPATVAGIEKYLGSGLIEGVGPVTAKRIVDHFGVDTLNVIDNEPERLRTVPGVGRKRVEMVIQAWAEQRTIKEVMIFLQGHGVSTSLATRIFKRYGDDAITIVQENPYRLSQDIFGIGFASADTIARALGIEPDSVKRIAAGLEHILESAANEGHVYLPAAELIDRAVQLLSISRELAAHGLHHLRSADRVRITADAGGDAPSLTWQVTDIFGPDSDPQTFLAEERSHYGQPAPDELAELLERPHAVYLTPLFYSELGVTNQILRLLSQGESTLQALTLDWDAHFETLERETQFRLAPQQREAVETTFARRITILTGGPGTGKTTTVRTILQTCRQARLGVVLTAPTGRAAKRLGETTGAEAKTIHRLLEFQPGQGMRFKRSEESPLAADLIIVDEASMLDQALTHHLLKAVPAGAHLLLVGDIDQLPSVGAGNVLEDIIAAIDGSTIDGDERTLAGAAVVRLQTIFRQAEDSFIIQNAHLINQGERPIIRNDSAQDFFFFRTQSPERAAELTVELVKARIPRRFGFRPEQIQVLSPMHRGVVGVGALNEALQQALNPAREHRAERAVGNRIYRVGDRVMQIRNNYDKEVFNGDMGYIRGVHTADQKIEVEIDGRIIPYSFLELDELTHAYAISVHKSQGSEYPAVVLPLLTSHYMMLQRNLLYTAVTRARELVVLVGQERAVALAVANNEVARRYTGLTARLLRAVSTPDRLRNLP